MLGSMAMRRVINDDSGKRETFIPRCRSAAYDRRAGNAQLAQ